MSNPSCLVDPFRVVLFYLRPSRLEYELTFAKDSSFVAPAFFPPVGTEAFNPLRTKCLPLAMMNPPLFYGILLAASKSLALRGVCNSHQATVYRGRTIRLINGALYDKERAVEDTTFAAVVHLAFNEVSVAA
jgi:hypothetical protein